MTAHECTDDAVMCRDLTAIAAARATGDDAISDARTALASRVKKWSESVAFGLDLPAILDAWEATRDTWGDDESVLNVTDWDDLSRATADDARDAFETVALHHLHGAVLDGWDSLRSEIDEIITAVPGLTMPAADDVPVLEDVDLSYVYGWEGLHHSTVEVLKGVGKRSFVGEASGGAVAAGATGAAGALRAALGSLAGVLVVGGVGVEWARLRTRLRVAIVAAVRSDPNGVQMHLSGALRELGLDTANAHLAPLRAQLDARAAYTRQAHEHAVSQHDALLAALQPAASASPA